ncbi:hypothetical protein, partial [Mycoplasmopsis opalescens]|uniref:hypothetical protein n=1 Tax=Mycoplasmopsis opalescens TaxID=114886 RepID=UPI0004A6F9BA
LKIEDKNELFVNDYLKRKHLIPIPEAIKLAKLNATGYTFNTYLSKKIELIYKIGNKEIVSDEEKFLIKEIFETLQETQKYLSNILNF